MIRDLLGPACIAATLSCGWFPLWAQAPPSATAQRTDGPYYAGIGRVTNPVILQDTKVSPSYPRKARRKGIQGRCILQAVIERNGTVGKVAAMETRITRKDGSVETVHWPRRPKDDYGFAAASEAAVLRWRYEPGTLDGTPVAVFFTVVVDFVLR